MNKQISIPCYTRMYTHKNKNRYLVFGVYATTFSLRTR